MQNAGITNVLTIEAAAEMYRNQGRGLTASAIRRLVRSGEIPSRKVGSKYLIAQNAIEGWLNLSPVCNELPHEQIRRVAE